ncbi:hypothetical protein SDC9_64905 [bioreactor metagenome]|uniref:Uncharacterized protein n=1 Tax=bioreactor metagenome TaxID=1076179 RepID=A0A644XWQ6_9ZZZZ
MNTNDIKNLLERFYGGNTSLEEEKILADFLLRQDVPDEFLSDKKLFCALNAHPVEIPDESTKAIESLIDSFKEVQPSDKKTIYWVIGIAASLALIFGVRQFQKSQQPESTLFTDTYKNPDDAYRATVNALQLFSENFSKGTESVEKANMHLGKAQKIINQSLK